MPFLKPNHHPFFFAAFFSLAVAATSSGQTLTEMRDWSSNDGKTIRAELLTFTPREAPGTARFRVKDGAVFNLPISRFSRDDQAVILKEKINASFRVEFSKRRDSCFFYSKHLAEDDWNNRSWAYFGSDFDNSWLRLAIYSEPGFFSEGNTVIIIGTGAPVRIEYDEDDIDSEGGFRSSYEGIDTLITSQAADLLRVTQDSSKLEFFLEASDGTIKPIPLSKEEIAGIQATCHAFRQVAPLGEDHTWWATLINRSPEEFRTELSDPLLAWRNPAIEASLPMKSWSRSDGETIEAELLGFDRDQAILRDPEGELHAWITTEFESRELEFLAHHRLELSLDESWHPIEDHHQFFWSSGTSSDARFHRPAILLALDDRDQTPRLALQYRFEGDPEALPLKIDLTDENTSTRLGFPIDQPLKLRTSSGVIVWELLRDDQIDTLLEISPEVESLTFDGRTSMGETESIEISGKALKPSLEALEIFRMLSQSAPASLITSETSDPPTVEEPATPEATVEPQSLLKASEIPPPVEEIFSPIGN